tara:strand:- start:494 stop:673 length:180 start_codon:yes stop_codon:yes gene_type:complete
MEHETKKFIKEILVSLLQDKRKELIRMRDDKECSIGIYETALDTCKKIEYSIEQLEKIK